MLEFHQLHALGQTPLWLGPAHCSTRRCHQCGIWYVAALGNHLTLDSSRKNGTSSLSEGVLSTDGFEEVVGDSF